MKSDGAVSAKAVLLLAAPAVANSLLQTMVFVVDRAVLGHFDDTAIAAMQTAGPLSWTLFSVFGSFAVGTIATVGRAVGANDRAGAVRAARASVLLALAIGLVVGALGWLFAGAMVDAFGDAAGREVRDVSVGYLRVLLPAMPAFFLGFAAISSLQAAGDTRTPLAIGVATNVVNLVANWVLVFGHFGFDPMGAKGSAIGSVIAATLEATLALAALSRAHAKVSLRAPDDNDREKARVDRRAFSALLGVTYGSFGERVVYHIGYLLFVRFVTGLGAHAMAANQSLVAIESICFLTADGFGVAAGALVAQRLGADAPLEARRAGWLATAQCAFALGACGVVFASFPAALVRLFVEDASIVTLATPVLRFAALAQIPMAIGVVLAQSTRAAGATREAFAVSLASALIVRIAATYVFVRVLGLGLLGVWMGSTVDWVVRAIVYGVRWQQGRALGLSAAGGP
ncbi:MAG: MATE family efflux transporter [Myxococcales bacterium]|nr:MATE family efflux transporter [Myxococcales bacterium]